MEKSNTMNAKQAGEAYRPPSPTSPAKPRTMTRRFPSSIQTPKQQIQLPSTPKAPKHFSNLYSTSYTPQPPPTPIYRNFKAPVCARKNLRSNVAPSSEDESDPFSENYVPVALRNRRLDRTSDGWSDSSDEEDEAVTLKRKEARDRWRRLPGEKGSDLVLTLSVSSLYTVLLI
ncbi:hypothetical protein BT69DRAFT_1030084 [Atractiella rhizophila]|nr:hypothetical protein BT69DRAFT_1030084 [Atractiella rhizophila]